MAVQRSGFTVAIEAVAIFSSVFLAFLVEEWRDDRRAVTKMTEAVGAIEVELRSNLEALHASRDHHLEATENLRLQIQALVEDSVIPDFDTVPALQAPILSTAAYRLGLETGALAPLDAERLIAMERAYGAIGEVEAARLNLASRSASVRYNDLEDWLTGRLYYFVAASEGADKAIALIDATMHEPLE